QNDPSRLEPADFFDRRRARQHGGKNLLLTNPARDQLRILAAEVENHDAAEFRLHPASLLSYSLRRLSCRALHHAIPLTPRRDSPACPARRFSSRSACHSHAAPRSVLKLPAPQDPIRGDPRALEIYRAHGHSLGPLLPLRFPSPASDHNQAISPATDRHCVRASPTVPLPGAGPWEQASMLQSPT